MRKTFRYQIPKLVAILLIGMAYHFAAPPTLSHTERAALASQYAFQQFPLPALSSYEAKGIRQVHPDLQHISAWISSVGASISLNDLDGDGLSNDICYVDTAIDQVVITPVPGTGARYATFTLNPAPLPYDSSQMAPMGCLPGDFNEDGLMDVLVYYWGRTPVIFLQHTLSTSFMKTSYKPQEVVAGGQRWFTNAATQADIDGDGHIDLVIGNYFPDGAHILNAADASAQFMQDSMSKAFNGGTNHILLWAQASSGADPTVTFVEALNVFDDDVARGWTLAVGVADLNGDLLPEIYLANDFGPDRLLYNQSKPGQVKFLTLEGLRAIDTPKSKVLGQDSFKGMGIDFGDVNGDGFLDIYVSNIAAEYALEESHFLFLSTGAVELMAAGIAPYVDYSEALGLSRSNWGWESRLADFNNDGVLEAIQATGFVKGDVDRWPELHELAMGNDTLLRFPLAWPQFQPGDDLSGDSHLFFFVQAGDGRFYDLSAEVGIGALQVTRGIATADVDGNGTLDFAVANQWDTSYFYRNECPACGAFLGLHLLLPSAANTTRLVRPGHPGADTSGYPAIGTAVQVELPTGEIRIAQVDGGNGHSGKRSPEIHLGLGDLAAAAPLQVTISWRNAQGVNQQDTLTLTPGWYTIVLGQ